MGVKRSNTIQIARGIAILMVIFHHICNVLDANIFVGNIVSLVNRVHVVVFFVISGWLFEKKKRVYQSEGFFKFFVNKFLQLFLPYFIFSYIFSMLVYFGRKVSFLYVVVTKISGGIQKGFFESFFDIILFKNVYFESLWFVYIMFIFMIVMYFLLEDRYINTSIVVGTVLFGGICKALFFDELVSMPVLNDFISYIGWVFFGRWLYFNRGFTRLVLDSNCLKNTCVFLSFCVIVRCCFLDITGFGSALFRAFYIQLEILSFRVAFLFLLYRLCKFLEKSSIGNILKKLGDMSYKVYLIHNPWFVSSVGLILNRVANGSVGVILGCFLVLFFSIISIFIIDKYLSRVSKVIFGGLRV